MFGGKLSFALGGGVLALVLGMLMIIPATSASASSGSSTLFGSSISSPSNLATKTNQFGRLSVVRVYFPGLPSRSAWSTGLAGANHSAIVVSFKVLPLDIISNDAGHEAAVSAVENFFDTAPRSFPIYWVYWHEPEDNIAAKQFTLADYLKAWGDIVRMADAAHNSDLRSTLVLMGFDVLPHSGRNWKSYLPPGNIISTISWDTYPVDGVGTPSPASFMAADVAASRAAHMPFGFSEFNTTTVPGRPAWLTAVGAYIRSSGALYGTLYDASDMGGIGGRGTFVISDGGSENAWNSVVGGGVSRHGNGGTKPPPTLLWNENSFGVAIVQYGLKWLRFYPEHGAVNGHYGPVTADAVRTFQRDYRCQPPDNEARFYPSSWYAMANARGGTTSMPTLVWHEASLGVLIVQYGLQRLGFYPGSGAINGYYGPVTDKAIRAFQTQYKSVPAYGASRFGPGSWAAMTNAHLS
jgi:hypothetical protein